MAWLTKPFDPQNLHRHFILNTSVWFGFSDIKQKCFRSSKQFVQVLSSEYYSSAAINGRGQKVISSILWDPFILIQHNYIWLQLENVAKSTGKLQCHHGRCLQVNHRCRLCAQTSNWVYVKTEVSFLWFQLKPQSQSDMQSHRKCTLTLWEQQCLRLAWQLGEGQFSCSWGNCDCPRNLIKSTWFTKVFSISHASLQNKRQQQGMP